MNNIIIKSEKELACMSEGGRILAIILTELKKNTQAGITTNEINEEAEKLFQKLNVQASFKGYRGFPASICTCVNEEVVHGIPGSRKLREGDILTIDCGVYHKGFHTDSAITIAIGEIKPEIRQFIQQVEKTLYKTIDLIKPGIRIGDISAFIQHNIESKGYSIVHELTGHGVGKNLHEAPMVYNFGKKGSGPVLKPGMTIAIEPIANMGKRFIKTLEDKWTIVSKDNSPSCQFEHTIAITTTGAKILTL